MSTYPQVHSPDSHRFADDTRERILVILFRLTIDVSLMKDTIVCSEVERTITTVLEAIPEDGTDDTVGYPNTARNIPLTVFRYIESAHPYMTLLKTPHSKAASSNTRSQHQAGYHYYAAVSLSPT